MPDYPFLDPAVRYYVAGARMTACARYIQEMAAAGIRTDNDRWRIGRSGGYGGVQDGCTARWIIRNYPSVLPNNEWKEPGVRIVGVPMLMATVALGFRGGYGAGQAEAVLSFPPTYSMEDGKPEPNGSCYDIQLHTSLLYIGADGARSTVYSESLVLTTPTSVDSILNDVGAALLEADRAFASNLPNYGLNYSDPVPTPPETVRLIGREYNELLRQQADNESARAIGEEFRLWCQAHKGVSTVEAGLRACSTAELMDWFAKIGSMGWYLQRRAGEDMGRRVLAYDAAITAAREAALLPIKHINPWGGEDGG